MALVELFYSEQLADPERGIENAARRHMADKLLGLSEHMWQSYGGDGVDAADRAVPGGVG